MFVVGKILDSSESLSCLLSILIDLGVEYCQVCIREGLLCGKGVEPSRGRGRLKWSSGDAAVFFYKKGLKKREKEKCTRQRDDNANQCLIDRA